MRTLIRSTVSAAQPDLTVPARLPERVRACDSGARFIIGRLLSGSVKNLGHPACLSRADQRG